MSEKAATYKLPRISEHEEQASFIQEVELRFTFRDDFVSILLFATLNGAWLGGNRFALMNKYKDEGFKKGVADLLYLQPRGDYSCLAIEMKAQDQRGEKSGGVSRDQSEFLAAVNANGGTGEVCYGADEAVALFTWYMSLPQKG